MSFLFSAFLRALNPPPKTRRRKRVRRRVVKDPFAAPSTFLFQGETLPLCIEQNPDKPHACVRTAEAFCVNVPDQALTGAALQAEAALSLKLWIKRETRALFAERLAFWSERLGVVPRRMVVTAPIARWGSCTFDNEIRLNWRLIQLPAPVMDYVIAHEVCHITHKNHGPAFWAAVEKLIPDCKTRRAELRSLEKTVLA